MNRKKMCVVGLSMGLLQALGCEQMEKKPGAEAKQEAPPVLAQLAKDISSALSRLDAALAGDAKELGKTGLVGPQTRPILRGLCNAGPGIVDCVVMNPQGALAVVEPEAYRKFEGANILKQEQIVELRRTMRPVMSEVIETVEGVDGVVVTHPVIDASGKWLGTVNMLIKPEDFLSAVITPAAAGKSVEVWLMQKDGRILYDADREEIGRMIFTDPMYQPYPESLARAREIAKEDHGMTVYKFLAEGLTKPVAKEAYWTTVGLHGTEWRLVVVRVKENRP